LFSDQTVKLRRGNPQSLSYLERGTWRQWTAIQKVTNHGCPALRPGLVAADEGALPSDAQPPIPVPIWAREFLYDGWEALLMCRPRRLGTALCAQDLSGG
jgi:hypothetical protein